MFKKLHIFKYFSVFFLLTLFFDYSAGAAEQSVRLIVPGCGV